MPESYEFRVFDDNMKRQFLLNQILEQEVQLFSLFVAPLDEKRSTIRWVEVERWGNKKIT